MAMSSSGAEWVPGISPWRDLCRIVRLVLKPRAPASSASAGEPGHLAELVGGDVVVVGPLAEDERPQGDVGHLGGDVHDARHRSRGRRGTRRSVSHDQSMPSCSAVPGMSSTASISSMRKSWPPVRTGANPTPQLPITTVVAPCQLDGARLGSHVAWPS